MSARRYLEEFGVRIADNGYEVIPILPGEKRPYGKRWQTYDGSAEGVQDWIKDGKGSFGCGIKTRRNPAVDIDVHTPAVVEEIRDMVFAITGETLRRVGLPPKELLVFRTDEPFPKVDSGFWIDDKGRTVKCEILADGQQFVAAHIHPDTGKPYQWIGKSVLNTESKDLPLLTHEMANQIRDAAIQVFLGHGWTKKSNAVTRLASNYDPDDVFAAVKAKTQITDEKLFDKLMKVPNAEDYDTWFHVGMALWHQYDGEQFGLDLWHQWSATAGNYDAKVLDSKWKTFDIQQKDRTPITARFILKQAKDVEAETNTKLLEEVQRDLAVAETLAALESVCEVIRHTEFSVTVREMLVGNVKDQFKRITKVMPRIGIVRDLTRYESPTNHAMPGWLKNWVYCQFEDQFFNTLDRRMLGTSSFDRSHARLLLTPAERLEGRSVPETLPSAAALNLYQIPTVYLRQYWPGMGPFYTVDGIDYVNSYSDMGIPEVPGEMTSPERQAIEIIEKHFEHLFTNARDRRIFLDWLCYIVQNPGKRVNWAIFIQGAEGDGKSFFYQLLMAVIGATNVNVIAGSALEEKYNPWAEGAQVCFVEDVRLHGANRFDAVNKLKPMVTNPTATIRRMNTDIYTVVNTMNYIATANLKDAIPVGDEDSRFFNLFSRFQSQAAIRAFKRAHPDYYRRLHGALEFAGALRKWMLERELSADFDPKERSPESSYKAEMVEMNRRDDERALLDSLEENPRADYSELLLDSALISDEFMGRDALAPSTQALNRLLSTQGFTFLGRYKVAGEKRRFWSKRPDVWSEDSERRGDEIREYLDPEGL